jgi:hypothetical protein
MDLRSYGRRLVRRNELVAETEIRSLKIKIGEYIDNNILRTDKSEGEITIDGSNDEVMKDVIIYAQDEFKGFLDITYNKTNDKNYTITVKLTEMTKKIYGLLEIHSESVKEPTKETAKEPTKPDETVKELAKEPTKESAKESAKETPKD